MMKIEFTSSFDRKYKRLTKGNKKLKSKVRETIRQFRGDPTYPSLKNHKLHGQLKENWSFKVEEDLVIVYYWEEGKAILFDIGTHDEVYRR